MGSDLLHLPPPQSQQGSGRVCVVDVDPVVAENHGVSPSHFNHPGVGAWPAIARTWRARSVID